MTRQTTIALATLAFAAGIAGAQTTVVDFDDGDTHGWEGPQGVGGISYLDPTHGVGGSGGYRTEFNDFGIVFSNSTNSAFVGDYTQYDEVTISFDLRIDQIGFSGLGISRPFMLELRNSTLGDAGYPWASAFYEFGWYSDSSFNGFANFSVTFNPNDPTLPAGWGGYGSYDPVTFETALPAGVTFADVLAGVDTIAISTLLPDYFFTNDSYDLTVDNITITAVPAPGASALLVLGGLVGTRRRR
ncbi:MAG: hypothetical protein RBS39_13150 [Phycisphaerales bacterium]|jgi:hypothetical protein|nr:hypothetical protein [Phycisphaerales bacterium]